ncbi:hypothetical protein K491DRAFT_142487 [Lophiostoma macrostomum CBS 122681]|uniref:Uncharacterized protein n=1 Tax=Lophiostoma macrostomum CBS 122681 TaxID=1314788 RepID=A0A6A6SR16_9PLEO|nr:hypothetical protein K491DRAFT_142487 [Lophiostoma macrostomum CBS 122681]
MVREDSDIIHGIDVAVALLCLHSGAWCCQCVIILAHSSTVSLYWSKREVTEFA